MDRRSMLRKFGSAGVLAAIAGCASVQKQATTTAAGGGGGSDGADTTSTIEGGKATAWVARPSAEEKSIKQNIDQFNGQSPHTLEMSDISDLGKKTSSAIPAGQGPHTFEWAHDWIGDYYQSGFLADQSGKLDVSLDTFTDAAAQAVQFDGATLGLPTSAETVALLYNKEYVDSPPKTVSEMVDIMSEHHDPANGTYGLSYPLTPYFISGWAQAYGGYYFDPDKDPMLGLSKPETIKGFNLVADTFTKYMPEDTTYGPQASVFSTGNAPLAINGPWYLATLREKNLDFGVAELPTPDGGTPTPYTGIQLWYFSKKMQKDTPATNAARSFIEWYATNTDLLLEIAEKHGFIPVHEDLAGSDELPANVKGFSEAARQGIPMPTHPKVKAVWDPVKNAFKTALNGDESMESAMAGAEETIRSRWES
ncbi:extracellular solute-binding protein [Halospeciosus flavus]|uniref:Extracellular solute-binding protein n=1 Tax=Halospeciosus flavus TaxID=3032283 RepID=A0ABD5Z197_9EURY